MFKKSKPDIEKELIKEVKELTREVAKLKDLEFMKVFKHPLKFLGFSFLKGVMIGFGSVLGASVLVAIFIYLLAKISLVPVVGDFVREVMLEIQSSQNFTDQNEIKENEPTKRKIST